MQLKIAFMGYNRQQTDYGIRKFADDHRQDVWRLANGNSLILNDGTEIRIIYPNEDMSMRLRGVQIDQLVLFDDKRWNIEFDRSDAIQEVLLCMKGRSRVPQEFWILKYEND